MSRLKHWIMIILIFPFIFLFGQEKPKQDKTYEQKQQEKVQQLEALKKKYEQQKVQIDSLKQDTTKIKKK